MIQRTAEINKIKELLSIFPAVAILGARQIGKTTLSKLINAEHYFDLENPVDLAKFDNPKLTLESLSGLIVIDEIQRAADLFPLLRFLIDNHKTQKYLILGSASKDLIKQSSESLAGRIGYHYLSGFNLKEVGYENWKDLWIKGGYPRAFLSQTNRESALWLDNYITTFLERDIPQLGITIPANTLRRFWMMLSHYHGQVINYSELARSFGISDMTIRKYINILSGTFMIRVLYPWYSNTTKRLVKRPKIYLCDSGIFHKLMNISSIDELYSHNKLGASWEGFVVEEVSRYLDKPETELFFWATHAHAELDLFWTHKSRNYGLEIKYQDAPKITKSMRIAVEDLDLSHLWVIYPGTKRYKLTEKISVISLEGFGKAHKEEAIG